jgi:hypothetical protein
VRTLDTILQAVLAFFGWLWRVIRTGATWYWAKLNPAGRVGVLVLLATTLLFAWAWLTKPGPGGPGGTPSAPVTVDHPVTFYKDRVVYVTKEGKPVTVTKPPESNPSVDPDGTLHVPQWGLCLIPKAGALVLLSEPSGLKPFAAFRVAYWKRFGLETGAATAGPMLGLDARLPVLNAITASVGTCPRLGLPFEAWRMYAGAGIFVRY